jgi:hypothetical protein
MAAPLVKEAPLQSNSGLTRYHSHNRLSIERSSQEMAPGKIDFYNENEGQSKRHKEHPVLSEIDEELVDSPNKGSISPLRKH